MKVAVLWTALSGYMNACLQELASHSGVELLVSHMRPTQDAPFDESGFAWMPRRFMWKSPADIGPLVPVLRSFDPDVIVVVGWHVPAYRQLAHEYAGRSWRVMTMDNPWRGTLKQWAGVLTAPLYLRPIADAVWLPGERQAQFARKLGFMESQILRGLYSCNQPAFEAQHWKRVRDGKPVPHAFLFAGRLVPPKGIEILARAYRLYHEQAADPWPLVCCGAGPLRPLLEGQPGVRVEGFVQPEAMTEKLAATGCFILPSIFEPWALVIHEAASAGLVILASETVGAAVHLVQPGFNGFIFDDRDVQGLAHLMMRVSTLSSTRLDEMSRASNLLSRQFTPARWANTLIEAHAARNHIGQCG
ncbi:MAG TPA: glycosyltransferase family 4 protein [Terracidiphilus sp.]|nr:glycosyltransferase family 4 protein [Terracidiphilus sp.]